MVASTRTVTVAGTTLAHEGSVSERPAETWRGRRNRYFVEEAANMSRFAMAMGAVVHASVLLILLDGGVPSWRVAICGGLFALFAVLQRVFARRTRSEPNCIESALVVTNIAAQVFVVGSATI